MRGHRPTPAEQEVGDRAGAQIVGKGDGYPERLRSSYLAGGSPAEIVQRTREKCELECASDHHRLPLPRGELPPWRAVAQGYAPGVQEDAR